MFSYRSFKILEAQLEDGLGVEVETEYSESAQDKTNSSKNFGVKPELYRRAITVNHIYNLLKATQ